MRPQTKARHIFEKIKDDPYQVLESLSNLLRYEMESRREEARARQQREEAATRKLVDFAKDRVLYN